MTTVDTALLGKSPLVESLLPVELEALGRLMAVRVAAPDEVVIREGDTGDALYIVANGVLDVLVSGPGGDVVVGAVGEGDFFGEISLIDKEPRSATVRVREEEATLYVLTQEALHQFAKVHRNGFTWLIVNVARGLAQRLREANRKLASTR